MTRLTDRDGIPILVHKHDERQTKMIPKSQWLTSLQHMNLTPHVCFQRMNPFNPWLYSTNALFLSMNPFNYSPFQPINAFSTWTPQSIHPFNTWTLSTRESFQPRHDFNTSVFQPVHRPSLWILPFIQCILPFNSSFQQIRFKSVLWLKRYVNKINVIKTLW